MREGTTGSECVVLTGATGFLGKVVLEELLRTRENVHVIVIVRAKGKHSAADRLKQLRASPCFAGLTAAHFERVEAVEGDLASAGCGLHPDDRRQITERATRIVHCAASIDFDLRIEEAAKANIDATLNVMKLATACERLVSMVSVSTAYVTPNPHGTPIREELVPLPWNPEKLYEHIRGGNTTTGELTAVSGHPNSYTLTKCLAEHLIASRFPDLPITIVRPSIISACEHYPKPGWLDSRAAFAAFVALIGSGHLRAIVANRKTVMDVVPCDVVAIHILQELFRRGDTAGPADGPRTASAAGHTHAPDHALAADHSNGPITIRHSVTGIENGPSVAQAGNEILRFFRRYPVDHPPRLRYVGPANYLFSVADYFEHTRGLGSRRIPMSPAKAKFVRKQVHYVNRAFRYFTLNSFDFRTSLEWPFRRQPIESYLRTICDGVYRHLLRGRPHSLLIGGRRFGTLYRELSYAASEPGLVRRLGRQVSRRADKLTVDEEALARLRGNAQDGSLVVFRPGGRLSGAETSVLCAYTLMVRSHLGFTALWIAPGASLPESVASAIGRDVQSDTRSGDPVVIAARGTRQQTKLTVMRDVRSLKARLENAPKILCAKVAASLEMVRGVPDSDDDGETPVMLASDSALAGLRDGACGPRLLARATRALGTETDRFYRIHLGFEAPE